MREDNKVTLFNGLWVNDRRYNIRAILCMMAIEIILAYSPFGFLILGSVSVTTLFIGVMCGALWGGPISGACVGLVFGLCSMWKASVTAANPGDLIFSPLFSGDPMASVVLALVPRILFGITAGVIYYLVLRFVPKKGHIPVIIAASVLLDRINSMLTYLFMEITFQYKGAYAMKAFEEPFSEKRIKTYLIVAAIMIAVYILYDKYGSRKYYDEFRESVIISKTTKLINGSVLLVSTLIILCMAAHLWEREKIILVDIDQIDLAMLSVWRFNNVFLQFMVAALAAFSVAAVLFKHTRSVEENRRLQAVFQLETERAYAKEMEHRAMKDPLTGAYNRSGWEEEVRSLEHAGRSYAIMTFDIDDFKSKNDKFGHDTGDRILVEVVRLFNTHFRAGDKIFRFGGDEFVILISDCDRENEHFLTEKIEKLNAENLKSDKKNNLPPFSISAGIAFSDGVASGEELYKRADTALYKAKDSGKGCCRIYAD